MLQLRGPLTCLERKCWQERVLSNNEQSDPERLIKSFCWTRCIVSQATHWKSRDEICSVKQIQKFKDTKGRINTSKTFNAMCQKFKMKLKVGKLRVENKLKIEVPDCQSLYNTSSSSEVKQFQHERDALTSHGRFLETERQARQCSVSSFEAQNCADTSIEQMLDVERQKSNTLQAHVLRSKVVCAQSQARCEEFWRSFEPHSIREMKHLSQELERMHVAQNHESAAS